MELDYSPEKIVFNRELSDLDELVLKFVDILHRLDISYVIISGYIAILFGRSRGTEDVDLFVEKIGMDKMSEWWFELEKAGFECLNTDNPTDALNEYLENNTAIRFAVKGTWEPNFEVKFPTSKSSHYSMENKLVVFLNNRKIVTSQIEMQIAYKLLLRGDKDLEDALHLYGLFKDKLDHSLLRLHIQELGVPPERVNVLWEIHPSD
ncbi:MAG: hypothetical protein AABW68_04860 [archaeon]